MGYQTVERLAEGQSQFLHCMILCHAKSSKIEDSDDRCAVDDHPTQKFRGSALASTSWPPDPPPLAGAGQDSDDH